MKTKKANIYVLPIILILVLIIFFILFGFGMWEDIKDTKITNTISPICTDIGYSNYDYSLDNNTFYCYKYVRDDETGIIEKYRTQHYNLEDHIN